MNKDSINTIFSTHEVMETKTITHNKIFNSTTAYHVRISPTSSYHYESERNVWNKSLLRVCEFCKDTTLTLVDSERFTDILNYISNLPVNSDQELEVIEGARSAYINYYEDHESNKLNKFADPSIDSLLQLIRFVPEISKLEHNVYIDENSGAFGLTLKSNKKSKPILNLLMKENKEITFSFIKKGKGMIKITGRAFLNHNLEDSHEISNLIRMVKF